MKASDEVERVISTLQADVDKLKNEIHGLGEGHTVPAAAKTCTAADYILERLVQLGVTVMFGVPGDFNLGFLDYVEAHPKIRWAGNCNELNAAYAADGYARVKQGSLGVVLTTFGVGELSALNGIAGAFAERVPVLHIVGVPNTAQQKTKPLLHHTLGNGRYDAYEKAFENFVYTHTNLLDEATVAAEIDRVITAAVVFAKPTYLMLPTDIVHLKISSERLQKPLDLDPPSNDPEVEGFVLDEIIKLVDAAQRDVVILADACAIRYHVKEELKAFVEKTRFPVYSAPMGKTAMPETYERYGGIYDGSISRPGVLERVENAKLIIWVGGVHSDYNTGQFSNQTPPSRLVELHSDQTVVKYATFKSIGMKYLLPKLTERLAPLAGDAEQIKVLGFVSPVPKDDSETIVHSWLWPRLGQFFRSGDVIVADTGTSSFGLIDVPFPEGAMYVAQILWGSIGWSVGATLGAALAARDLGQPRTILFVGDGSMQLTFQELSTIQRLGLKPIIFLINNAGYTIEKYIHGHKAKYNDISNWRWTHLLQTLGGVEGETCQSYKVETKKELARLLDNEEFARAEKIQLVEIITPVLDAPRALKMQAELSGLANKYTV